MIGTSRFACWTDKAELPTFMAALAESGRVRASIPVTVRIGRGGGRGVGLNILSMFEFTSIQTKCQVARRTTKDVTLGGYTIAKGTNVFPMAAHLHGNDLEYNPTRYLDGGSGNKSALKQGWEFVLDA